MSNFADLFSGDAFTLESMIAAINDIDHIPSRAGQLVFAHRDVTAPVNTLDVAIERVDQHLKLVATTARGAPAEKEQADKRSLIKLSVPHIQIEDTIQADSVQGVREFGTRVALLPQISAQGDAHGRAHELAIHHARGWRVALDRGRARRGRSGFGKRVRLRRGLHGRRRAARLHQLLPHGRAISVAV